MRPYQGSTLLSVGLVAEAYFLFYRLYPVEFSLLATIRSKAVRERISAQQYAELESLEQSALNIVKEIITEGVCQEELSLDDTLSPDELACGVWFMLYGALNLYRGKPFQGAELDRYLQLARNNFQYYVACWPWSAEVSGDRSKNEELGRCYKHS